MDEEMEEKSADLTENLVPKSFELFGKRGATLGVILAENGSSVEDLTGKLKDSPEKLTCLLNICPLIA